MLNLGSAIPASVVILPAAKQRRVYIRDDDGGVFASNGRCHQTMAGCGVTGWMGYGDCDWMLEDAMAGHNMYRAYS